MAKRQSQPSTWRAPQGIEVNQPAATLLRGVIDEPTVCQFDGTPVHPPQDVLQHSLTMLRSVWPDIWKRPDDERILAQIEGSLAAVKRLPTRTELDDHFTRECDIEVTERLKVIFGPNVPLLTSTNYHFILGKTLTEYQGYERQAVEKEALDVTRDKGLLAGVDFRSTRFKALAERHARTLEAFRTQIAPETASSGPKPITTADIFAAWAEGGALVYEPTGFPALDDLTGGGFVYGTRVTVAGAPDACKTALLVQFLHACLLAGIVVGLYSTDEEGGDTLTRLLQRIGFSRHECEVRDPDMLPKMAERLGDLPLRIYDESWTIEAAAKHLHEFAKSRHPGVDKPRCIFLIDSIQTVQCDKTLAAQREPSVRELVSANMMAFKRVCIAHRMLGITTSEMNRASYGTDEASRTTTDMAAAAESRAIEYCSRILITLRSVTGESDLIQVRVPKNKHGPSFPASDKAQFYLRIHRATQTLTQTTAPDKPVTAGVEDPKFIAKCAGLHQFIIDKPGIGMTELKARARAANLKIGNDGFDGLLLRLVDDGKIENRPETHGKRVDAHYYPVSLLVDAAVTATHLNGVGTDDHSFMARQLEDT